MHSQLFVLATLLVCGALTVNGSPLVDFIQSQADQYLLNHIMQSRAAHKDGSNVFECFNHYVPIINGITDTYQTNYKACITTASSAIDELIALGDDSRKQITEVSNDVCSKFTKCQNESENLSFFDCYSVLGDESVRQIYNASKDASESAANYRETYHLILVKQDKCTNDTQRAYVTDNSKAYADLDDCFANGLNPDVSTSTSSAPSPSTAAPTSPPEEEQPNAEDEPVQVEGLNDEIIKNRIQEVVADWEKANF